MLDSIDLNESQKRMLRMGVFAIFAFTMLGGGIYMQGHAFGLLGMRSSSGTPASPPASDQQKAPSSDSKLPDPSSTGDPAADTKTPSASEKQKKTKKERGSQPESNTMEQQMRPGDNLAEQGSDSRTQSESTERPSAETKESEPKRSSAETPELPERSQSEGEGAEDNSPLVYNPFTGETHEVMQLRHRLKKQELQLQKKQKELEMKKIKQQMENLGKKESDSPRAPQTNQMGPVQPADPAGQQQDRGGLNEEEKLERDRQMFDAHTFQALSPVRTDEGWSAYLQVDDSRSWVSEGDKLYALDVVDITEHKVTLEARYGLQRSYPYTYGGEN